MPSWSDSARRRNLKLAFSLRISSLTRKFSLKPVSSLKTSQSQMTLTSMPSRSFRKRRESSLKRRSAARGKKKRQITLQLRKS